MNSKIMQLLKSSNIDIIEFDCHFRRNMENRGRQVGYCVLSYLRTGRAMLRMNGKEYSHEAGSVILVPPNVLHDHIQVSKEAEYFWWHFSFKAFGEVDILNIFNLPVTISVKSKQFFEEDFSKYLQSMRDETSISQILYAKGLAFKILSYVLADFMAMETATLNLNIPKIFFEILYLISDCGETDISLEQLSKRFFLNPTYLSNQFKNYFGISPIHLHRQLQLERAKELLIGTNKSISEIGGILGFEYHSSFVRFFKKQLLQSPLQYRKNYQKWR